VLDLGPFPPLIFCQALRFPGGGGVQQLLADSALAQARGVGVGQGGLGERVWVLLSQVGVVLPSVGAGQGERVPGLDSEWFRPNGPGFAYRPWALVPGW